MSNQLSAESSPYLLQHAQNPVHWFAWGDEPFQRAIKENKPVLVSIGYAACHWCHVMEHESFENEEVAAFMNEHFINIKVDREEHPGVDHFYMDAVQAISGSGGWPLNVFVTPQRVPFYGGTYFPPKPLYGRLSWMQLLHNIIAVWKEKPEEVSAQSDQMLKYLKQVSIAAVQTTGEVWDHTTSRLAADNLLQQADKEKGGFGRAPKFPGTTAISYLLEHYYYTQHQPSLQQALKSLDAMIAGGIYDQLGGGFARYATDDNWLIPHFEKMLYDNALLITALCDAYSITKKQDYKNIIEETVAFTERELKNPSGGYYSALDADSESVEGKFYTWTWEDWKAVINDDVAAQHFGVTETGNWEHTNILHIAKPVQQIAAETGIDKEEIRKRINEAKHKLLSARVSRVRPLTDDKSLLSWNALMNIALSKAAMVLEQHDYLQTAEKHMQWMRESFVKNGEWLHTWKNGKARIAANLDDIAYLMKAKLQLAEATANEQYIIQANALAAIAEREFIGDNSTFFYYTSDLANDIPVRKVEVYDGATPSANAVMADNLLILGLTMENTNYLEQANAMLEAMASSAKRYTYSFAVWAALLQRNTCGIKTLICSNVEGDETRKLMAKYLPGVFILTSQKEISEIPLLKDKYNPGQKAYFVCTQQSCLAPMTETAQVLAYLVANKK